jgi:ferritin
MLISERMTEAFTVQIGNEFQASYQYVAIAAYFSAETLPELSKFFEAQAAEERDHALKIMSYVVDGGGKLVLPAVEAPKCDFAGAEEAVQLALDSELTVSGQINTLMNLAVEEQDHQAQNFLQWFLAEQREEVATMDTLLKMVHRAGETGLLHVEDFLARGGLTSIQQTAPA